MSAHFEVPGALAGERVDRAVALLTGRSRAEITGLVKAGKVLIEGRAASSGHAHVLVGQMIEVDLADTALHAPRLPLARSDLEFVVVYVDDDVIVIDKPAGLVVHPGAGHEDDTLVSGLLGAYPDLAVLAVDAAQTRPGIVHRLDKDTSGLLVVARSPRALTSLAAQLADRSMGRSYRTLVKGHPESDDGVVDAPIGRSFRDPKKMAVRAEGRYAKTTYRVLERFVDPESTSLLECVLSTGRTHQIRVHLSAIGHPVVGDRRYGGTTRTIPIARPFLHAYQLRFVHPGTGDEMAFESALPPELTTALALLS